MVPNLIWSPDFFGPQEIWAPRSLVPEKYGPQEIWSLHENHDMAFSCRAQISRGPNFLGPKKVRGPNEIGDHFSYSQSMLLKGRCYLQINLN